MREKLRFLPLYLVFILLVVGCGPKTCPAGSVLAPSLSSPANWAIVNTLSPTLSWNYTPGPAAYPQPYPYSYAGGSSGGGNVCYPDGYRIRLAMGPSFADDIGGYVSGASVNSWVTPSLQPGKEYRWGVQARSNGALGPLGGYWYFFTGPICDCDPANMVRPILVEPFGEIDESQPTLMWEYPQPCAQAGYRVDLSTDPTFADTSLSGGTGNPSTRWGPDQDLNNCLRYYWRVAAVCPDGTLGLFSNIGVFSVNTNPGSLICGQAYCLPKGNANCRYGDSDQWQIQTIATAGQILEIIGRNEDSSWFNVRMNEDVLCWLAAFTCTVNGDASRTPLVEVPDIPERKVKPGGCTPVYVGDKCVSCCPQYP